MFKIKHLALVMILFFSSHLHAEKIPLDTLWSTFMNAAHKHNVDPFMLIAIAEVESDFDDAAICHNRNGSVDVGIMQINEYWFPQLKKHTKNPRKALLSYKYNIDIGAWVFKQCVTRFGDSWKAIDCYNKGASNPKDNSYYNHKVWKKYQQYKQF